MGTSLVFLIYCCSNNLIAFEGRGKVDETQSHICYQMSSTKQSSCGWEHPDRNGRGIGQIRRLLNNSKGGKEHWRFGNLSSMGIYVNA